MLRLYEDFSIGDDDEVITPLTPRPALQGGGALHLRPVELMTPPPLTS